MNLNKSPIFVDDQTDFSNIRQIHFDDEKKWQRNLFNNQIKPNNVPSLNLNRMRSIQND